MQPKVMILLLHIVNEDLDELLNGIPAKDRIIDDIRNNFCNVAFDLISLPPHKPEQCLQYVIDVATMINHAEHRFDAMYVVPVTNDRIVNTSFNFGDTVKCEILTASLDCTMPRYSKDCGTFIDYEHWLEATIRGFANGISNNFKGE